MTTARICDIEPFRYQATAQPLGEENASANQINEQYLEDYLSRMREALCADIQGIIDNTDVTLSFLELTDTPDTYEGDEGKIVVVNAAEDGLEFFPSSFSGQSDKMVVVKNSEDGFELQDQPVLPSYFLTPNLVLMFPPFFASNVYGPTPVSVTGANVAITANPATLLQATPHFSFTAGAALNSNALGRVSAAFQCLRGNGAPHGGFRLRWKFGLDQYGAGARCFVGLYSSIAAQPFTTADPSAMTEVIFLGFDDTDTTWQIMHNDNAGTCTKVDTTLSIDTTSLLELTITMESSASQFDWVLKNLSTGDEFSGTPNSNLPQGGTPLTIAIQIGSAASGVQNRINHVFCSLEAGPN